MTKSFSQSFGRWAGNAEVYDGAGKFLGNGSDYRHVQALPHNRTRIDVSFVGPFKHSGHYFIQAADDHRLYQGPANVGYAETLSDALIDANAYWAALGLTQRFFLFVLPDGKTQLSLAQMSRGDQLIYTVVGQNDRFPESAAAPQPKLVSGTSFDLADDPTAGRAEILLHRSGVWQGELTVLDEYRAKRGTTRYTEKVKSGKRKVRVEIKGNAFDKLPRRFELTTNHYQAWTPPNAPVAGSYNLSGGRALSGYFHHLDKALRVWRREVVSLDGTQKVVVHYWYRGGERVGMQFGVLEFRG